MPSVTASPPPLLTQPAPEPAAGPRLRGTPALAALWLLALIVPALVGYDIAFQLRTPSVGFPVELQTGRVLAVRQGSWGDVSGFKAGDVILGPVDGSPQIETWGPAAPWMPADLGLHQVRVRRGEQALVRELPVLRLAQANALNLIAATAVSLTCWAGAVVLLLRRPHRPDVRLLFALAQAFGVLTLFPLAHPLNAEQLAPAQLLNLSYIAFYAMAPLLVHFHASFPVRLGTAGQRCRRLGGLYAITAIALALRLYALPRQPATDGLRDAASAIVAAEVAVAMGLLIMVYLRRATPDGRRRLRIIVAGSLVAALPGLLLFILPMILQDRAWIPEWALSLCLLAVPVSYLYATIRRQLFGIDRFLNRALTYVLLSAAIFTLYLGPLLLLTRLVRGDLLAQALTVTGITLLVSLSFDWARTQLQRWVDQLFYGGWYDYTRVVEHVSDALARALSPRRLTEVVTREVAQRMLLHEGTFHLISTDDERTMAEHGGARELARRHNRPTGSIRYPLAFEGAVRAVWTVGPRLDGDPLTDSDRRILDTLATQAEIALGNVLLVKRLRTQLAEIRTQRAALAGAQRQLLRSREEERARLARDLHDGPLQTLVGLRIHTELLATSPIGIRAGDGQTSLASISADLRTLLAELRQICTDLRPPMLDALGVTAALGVLVEDWQDQHGIPVDFHASSASRALTGGDVLPDEAAVNLYRIAQEAMANIARHAAAGRVTVRLSTTDSGSRRALRLRIHDDGTGFILPAALDNLAESGHFGLVGMRERAELIGAKLTVASSPGAGTTVAVDLPL